MIPPKNIIEFLFGVKIDKKTDWIINICILVLIISVFLMIL